MGAPFHHIRHQGPVIAALLGVGWDALFGSRPKALPALPTDRLTATVPARPDQLVDSYLRWQGGDPKRYREHLPAHLFPQWTFPLLGQTLAEVPYPLPKVLNQGCRVTVNAPVPRGQPLQLSARLVEVREEATKARLHQQIITGTAAHPEALVCDVFAAVPLPRDPSEPRPKRAPRAGVPLDATELAERRFGAGAGRDFAVLTGDINPIHCLPLAARAAGFRSCILHGFATLGWAWEGLVRRRLMGDVDRVAGVDIRFVRPMPLPATARLYTWPAGPDAPAGPDGTEAVSIAVAEAPGGPPWMVGTAWLRPADD